MDSIKEIKYKIIRKNNKNMYARLDKDNNLIITAPLFVSLKKIDQFAKESYEKLIKRKSKKTEKSIFNDLGEIKILGKYTKLDNLNELNGILLSVLKDYLRKKYLNIVQMMGINAVPNVKIKKVKHYLGQYNKRTNSISLNLLLGHMDEELIDYVIIHELAHTRYMGHQSDFWKEVSKYCPCYKTYRTKCKKEFVYYENY